MGSERLGKVAQSCNQYASAVCRSKELRLDVSVVWSWEPKHPKNPNLFGKSYVILVHDMCFFVQKMRVTRILHVVWITSMICLNTIFLNLGSTDLFPPIPESFQRIPPPIRLQGLRAFGLASNKNGYDAGKSTRWVFLGGQITKGKDIWVFPNIGVPLFLETPIYTIYHGNPMAWVIFWNLFLRL